MKKFLFLLFFSQLSTLTAPLCFSQITQTIRGKVVDKESKTPLIGASVILTTDTSKFIGSTTDIDGYFKLENIPIGRQSLRISFLGYSPVSLLSVIVISGKENVLNIEMEESAVAMKEVEITASRRGEVSNEMSVVSARAFTVEETDRYAGSRSDPARMAANFAGVQGADDSRNDIVIRGNSPLGLLWRVEGIDIPNPNHFSIPGSTGGPISVLNNKTLANSDFFTGAFPAEFGNSIAGVFDLKLRNGNNEKYESTAQFGLFGTELMSEGPISKEKRSSYLVAYRYSTLTIFKSLGIDLGTNATPRYQDLNFKLNFPMKNNANFSFFGMGGTSDIDILISDQNKPEREIYGQQDRDQYFGTRMGVLGASFTKSIHANSFLKVTAATSLEEQEAFHQLVYRHIDADGLFVNDSLVDKLKYSFKQGKNSIAAFINEKVNLKNTLKVGMNADEYRFNFQDSVYNEFVDSAFIDEFTNRWLKRWNYKGNAVLIQSYVQWKLKAAEDITLTLGLHNQYFTLNGSLSPVEPRIGVKWIVSGQHSLNAGFGMHSQIQPPYTYFYHLPNTEILHNKNMGFIKSNHYVIGHDYLPMENLRIKTEAYYQQLYNIPVEKNSSSFSLVNLGSGFSRFFPGNLENTGTAENYGAELTIEKYFSKKFFFLLTASIYDSRYRGSDGVKRNTDFNGNYIFNFLSSREFRLGEKSSFSIGTKVTAAGNKRYSPVDTLATIRTADIQWVDSLRNTKQFKDYFRADIKLNYRINMKKVTHEVGFDLVNILGTKNVLKLSYAPNPSDPTAEPIQEEYQLGFLPIFYYKADF